MAVEWRIAFPLHPEFRTLPMVWYCPPLSPIQAAAETERIGFDGEIPDVRRLRIPVRYLANLLAAQGERAEPTDFSLTVSPAPNGSRRKQERRGKLGAAKRRPRERADGKR